MIIEEKTEQNNALNSSIVPENQALLNPASLTQKQIEQTDAKPAQKKSWKGEVSLDSGEYNNKPQKDDVGHINNGIANGATKVGEQQLIKAITSGQSWSPTIFKDGLRKRDGFVAMSALVADFDDGFDSLGRNSRTGKTKRYRV